MRIFLPEITGVGVLRTRYPVMPVYEEGNPVWKELEALRDVVMDLQSHLKYFHTPPFSSFPAVSPPAGKVRERE